MKKGHVLALALFVVLQSHSLRGQGSLTPPGAPAPTMKTLTEIEPRTGISSIPYTISTAGSYYLQTNVSSSVGIAIATGNVTLDLNGFAILGTSVSGTAITISGNYTNITIRNGTIANWGTRGVDGYYSGAPRNVLVENLTVSGCGYGGIAADSDSIIRNCRCYANGFAGSLPGIYSHGGQVVDCIARGNTAVGIFGLDAIIRNCLAETNSGIGIECNGGSVLDCAAFDNTSYGISLSGGACARRCHSQGNINSGIYTYNTAPLLGGVISDCTVSTNNYGINLIGGGYLVTGNQLAYNINAGIIVQSSYNRIDNNHVLVGPGYYGIELPSSTFTNNLVIRNSCYGGGSARNFFSAVGNDIGPIGNASTNTSPWANISH